MTKHTIWAALAALAAKLKRTFVEPPKTKAVRQSTYPYPRRFSGVASARRAAKKRRARRR